MMKMPADYGLDRQNMMGNRAVTYHYAAQELNAAFSRSVADIPVKSSIALDYVNVERAYSLPREQNLAETNTDLVFTEFVSTAPNSKDWSLQRTHASVRSSARVDPDKREELVSRPARAVLDRHTTSGVVGLFYEYSSVKSLKRNENSLNRRQTA